MFLKKKVLTAQYIEMGALLRRRLVQSLGLPGWERDDDPAYTAEEAEAIHKGLAAFQKMADDLYGGEVVFHPDVFGSGMHRSLVRDALENLNSDWRWSSKDVLPSTWKANVSTYLKAWHVRPDPSILISMSPMLALAGLEGEAKNALEVVINHFSSYAQTYFGGTQNTEELSRSIVKEAQDSLANLVRSR